ncbi:hypothetical protein ON010_g4625 [Phytophthora cinnamomi]|nr:hypothetical protein ON010_g4625 [Phytophthora cinnamomi]
MMWRPPAGALLGLCPLNRNRRLAAPVPLRKDRNGRAFIIWRFRLGHNGRTGACRVFPGGNEGLRRRLSWRRGVRGRCGQRPNQPRGSAAPVQARSGAWDRKPPPWSDVNEPPIVHVTSAPIFKKTEYLSRGTAPRNLRPGQASERATERITGCESRDLSELKSGAGRDSSACLGAPTSTAGLGTLLLASAIGREEQGRPSAMGSAVEDNALITRSSTAAPGASSTEGGPLNQQACQARRGQIKLVQYGTVRAGASKPALNSGDSDQLQRGNTGKGFALRCARTRLALEHAKLCLGASVWTIPAAYRKVVGGHRRHRDRDMDEMLPAAAEKQLVRWANDLRADGVPMAGLMLKLQARDLYTATGLPRGAFTASWS